MFYQNDARWKNIKLGNSKYTIGSHGCVITFLCNIHHIRNKDDMTPIKLNSLLLEKNGYTADGLVYWNIVQDILKCRIDSDYKGSIEYDLNNYFSVNYNNTYIENGIKKTIGHFVNLIEKQGIEYFVFDVWDGLKKVKKHNEIRRVIKVFYK